MEVAWYGPQSRRFVEPVACLEAFVSQDVDATLARAESALEDGYAIAGYLAYEASRGFDRDRRAAGDVLPPERDELPLVALGVYRPAVDGAWANARATDARDARATIGPLVAQIDATQYARALAAIARALHAGDVYQVNYTVPFAFAFEGDPAALFARLRTSARVPFAAYVRHRERALLSLSPERFFELDGERLRTQPMKGTAAPEGTGALRSAKNRAEHVMIVDLLRNDMHRICDRVDVAPLFSIETYPTFATMTSTLDGHLRDDVRLRDIFAALFPCGSVTGAPKVNAMREIARREGDVRGIAMGTIGYCDAPRRGQWNVAIRTATLDGAAGTGTVRVGGGIVADSTPAAEWAEILIKRRAFSAHAARVGLIETLRVDVDGAMPREAAHRERLARSAFALGIPHDDACVAALLARHRSARRRLPALLRVLLRPDGSLAASERALGEIAPDPTIAVAPVRVRASDPALRHKTTARVAYDAASAFATANGCFDALLLDEDGAIADGARTTVFVRSPDGSLRTPPLASGALAGILRAELLADGRAREARLLPRDLASGGLFIGNAARGLVAVRRIDVPPSVAAPRSSGASFLR
ncbi:MAG: aminodeoxychorismate synthase component I [Vulcanimicrobiaceae bacterium]